MERHQGYISYHHRGKIKKIYLQSNLKLLERLISDFTRAKECKTKSEHSK